MSIAQADLAEADLEGGREATGGVVAGNSVYAAEELGDGGGDSWLPEAGFFGEMDKEMYKLRRHIRAYLLVRCKRRHIRAYLLVRSKPAPRATLAGELLVWNMALGANLKRIFLSLGKRQFFPESS